MGCGNSNSVNQKNNNFYSNLYLKKKTGIKQVRESNKKPSYKDKI